MFPVIDYDFEEAEVQEEELNNVILGKTPKYDFSTNQYVLKDGKIVYCTQEEAVLQWIGFLIKTTAGKYKVYDDTEFGTYIENYIGYKDSGFVASEIKREIEEKCILNRAISGIDNFEFDSESDGMHISFTVILNDTEEEVEVELIV